MSSAADATPPPPPRALSESPKRNGRPQKSAQATSAVVRASEEAEISWAKLEAELRTLGRQRKSSAVEILEALDVVDRISRQLSQLRTTADEASSLLLRDLAHSVEQMESRTLRESVSALPSVNSTVGTEVQPSEATEEKGDPKTADEHEPQLIPCSSYHIPKKVLETKMSLADGDVQKWWSPRFYVNKEGKCPDIYYCKSLESCERILPVFLDQKLLGFDMEWVYPTRTTSPRYWHL
jgi:hypothetical protein